MVRQACTRHRLPAPPPGLPTPPPDELSFFYERTRQVLRPVKETERLRPVQAL